MRVLVTGATGYIGGRLIPRLVGAGHNVVCLVRHPGRVAGRDWGDVEVLKGDVLDRASLDAAFRGVDVAYYLVHSMAEGEHGFEERDRIAAKNFGDAARQAGVQRIIYLGGLGVDNSDLSSHLASRQQVGDVLRECEVPVTEFRAAIVVGSGSISFEMIRYLTERLPVMITPRWVTTRCQPISVENVLNYLTECLGIPESVGRTFEIGGPDILTYGDMMREYARARKLRRFLIPVPVLTPRLSSYWVDLITPIPASYSHPLIEGLKSEAIVNDQSARDVFKIDLIPYAEAVSRALERTGSGDVETSWSGAQQRLKAGVTTSTGEGMIVEERRVESTAPPQAVFAAFSGIGGKRGWLYADFLWKIRGLMDRLVGGVGMRRGRRNPDMLRAGDALDFWRVEAVEPGRAVRLRAEMRVPGSATLEFEAMPRAEGGTLLIQTASFDPRGLAGLAYWYALYPIHQRMFSGMARAIVKRAESMA
ncbi:MAG: SDR family oxidoreductase [Gemmatimonadaceae bacterium]